MVISEAMAHGLPVVVYQADGTEYDLVEEGRTGILLKRGDAQEMQDAIRFLQAHPEQAEAWGANGQRLVRDRFTLKNMVESVMRGIRAACSKRQSVS